MSNRAINVRNNNSRISFRSQIFVCNVHGEVRSIHNRCPKCYQDRMKNYSSQIRNRNVHTRINRPSSTPSNDNYRPRFLPRLQNRRLISEPLQTNVIPSIDNRLRRNNILPPIVNHPPLPLIPRLTNNRNFNISDMIRVQRLLNDNDIRNLTLREREETPVNLQVLSRDTTICKSPNVGNCAICQENWEENDVVRKLPCNHVFHIMCIDKWFSTNNVCPICRHKMEKS